MTTLRAMRANGWLLLVFAGLVNAALLWSFHDRHWFVVDEGNYAHIAERLLDGEVLHRDVQDLHPGYINFLNAAAFEVFGVDLVSLRYPLVAATFIQALLIWGLLAGRNIWLATTASVAMTALGVIQFLNPTAHWYSLFVTVQLICWLSWLSPTHPARTFGAGVLLGVIILFRQLTGVWVAMAVLVILLRERSNGARGRDAVLARGATLLMLIALLAYLSFAGGPERSGILLLASWPVAILAIGVRDVGATNRASLSILSQLALGIAVAALPLVLYHAVNGSLTVWLDDVAFASLSLTTLPFFEGATFALLPAAGLLQVVSPPDLVAFANGLYWVVLSLLPLANGILTLRWMRSRRADAAILPLVAAFYSLVTLHLAGAVYLYYTVGLATAGVLWFAANGPRRRVPYVAAAAVFLVVIAVMFHAGQSSLRTPLEAARGRRSAEAGTATCAAFARSRLRVEWPECEPYRQLVEAIAAEAPAGTQIFAIPSDAELYFLAARSNPFRFYNSALGVRTPEDFAVVMGVLADHPPRVVTYRPDDKYNTDTSQRIMDYVRSSYDRFDTIAGVELYRPRSLPRQEVE